MTWPASKHCACRLTRSHRHPWHTPVCTAARRTCFLLAHTACSNRVGTCSFPCTTSRPGASSGHYLPPGTPPPPGPPHGYGYYGPPPPPAHYPAYGSSPYAVPSGQPRPPGGPPAPQRPRPPGGTAARFEGPRDPAKAAAVAINRRMTAAETAREIFDIVERVRRQGCGFRGHAHRWHGDSPGLQCTSCWLTSSLAGAGRVAVGRDAAMGQATARWAASLPRCRRVTCGPAVPEPPCPAGAPPV